MGLSSSQARLLSLTSRMHDIEYKAQKLEAQKLQMANESTHVYQEYENALNSTKIQYKTIGADGSANFVDASYASLCTYQAGSYTQYALADTRTNFIYVPQNIADEFNNAATGEDFALKMAGLATIPNGADTTTGNLKPVTPDATGDISLNRGQKASSKITTTPITLTLTNPLGGSNYTYTISADADTNASFEFLNNGRLVIKGSGLKIDASTSNSQNDDIILLGSNNTLNTNGGNDIVRIGTVYGFNGNYLTTSSNNTVNTGAGNDYVTSYGYNNKIDGGSGTDSFMIVSGVPSSVTGMEETYSANGTSLDGKDGWVTQGTLGDCRFLALMNSLTMNNKSLAPYVTISQSGNNFTVKFNNYTLGNNTITVNKSDIDASGYSGGDLDIRVMEFALNKLMQQNGDGTLASCTWNNISEYILGNSMMGVYGNSSTKFNQIWNDYKAGKINNIIVSTARTPNTAEGIVNNHAYTVKNVTSEYVELINPWDDKDIVKVPMSDFYNYFSNVAVFGSSLYNTGAVYSNGGISNESSDINLYVGDAASDLAKYNYYIRLYNAIVEAGGCTVIQDDMLNNTDWVTNMINGGFVYIKAVDYDGDWYDTNVATNTGLQEVSNDIKLKKAEAKYEADMRKIDAKDKKYDTDLAALEAERNAIKTEMDTLKTVANDNVDRTFKLFS